MSNANKKPSWRSQSYQPSTKSPSLTRRRWTATVLLAALSVSMVFVLWQWFILREAQTHLFAIVVNPTQTQSSRQDNLSVPPLRFTPSLPKAIAKIRSATHIHLTDELALNVTKLDERLRTIAKGSLRQDTLICLIQAQCMTVDDQAILVDANFLLPDQSKGSVADTAKGVPVAKVLELFSLFPGTVVLALDAGDVIADNAAHCEQNEFLFELHETLKQLPNDRLWVLTSHSPKEISQDDWTTRERLFGRALSEALLGTARVPNPDEFFQQWSYDRRLSLDEFANYVHRRVQADSGNTQSPWLMRGGQGALRSDKAGWRDARTITLAKLDRLGRVQGLVAKAPNASDNPPKGASNPAASDQKTSDLQTADQKTPLPISKDSWILNWKKFETEWSRKTSDAHYAWSIAECFPLSYRQRRAQLVDAELRSRAQLGESPALAFSAPPQPATWEQQVQRLRDLHESSPIEKRWDATELQQKREQSQLLQQLCQASLHVAELQQLATRLEAIGLRSQSPLKSLVDAFRSPLLSGDLKLEDPKLSELRIELLSLLSRWRDAIDALIAETLIAPKMLVLESLLLCNSLTPEQREKLLNKKMDTRLFGDKFPTYLPEIPTSWSSPPTSRESFSKLSPTTSADPSERSDLAKAIAKIVEQGIMDDRLVARVDQSISDSSQLALLPSLPVRKQGWWPEWQQTGRSLAQPVRLETTQRIELLLRLDPFPKPKEIRIQPGLLPQGIASLKLDGLRIDDSNPSLIRNWSTIEQNNQSIRVELECSDIAAPSNETLSLRVSSDSGPSNEIFPLRLKLATKDRIDLNVTRLVRKDGKEQWWSEEPSIPGKVFRLHPFSGHETRFSIDAIHRGENARTIQADLVRLPNRTGVPGILVSNNQLLQSDLGEDATLREIRKTAAMASVKSLELKPNQPTKLTLMSVGSPAASGSENAKRTPAVPSSEASPATSAPIVFDVSAGLALILTDANDGSVLESFLFEYDPSIPSEYIEAYASVRTEEQSRIISASAQFRDANEDGMPDLSPTDNQPIPIAFFKEAWMGLNPKGEFSGALDPKRVQPLKLNLQLSLDALPENQTFLALDVGGFPRALCNNISLRDAQRQLLESYKSDQARSAIRAVSDGTKTYWAVPPQDAKPDAKPDAQFVLGANSLAIFKQPKQLEVSVALDWAVDMFNGQINSAVVQMGETREWLYGDRKWSFQATKIAEDGFTLTANATDHLVRIDSSGVQNKVIALQAIAMEQPSKAIEVIFDSQPPEIRGVKLRSAEVFQGSDTSVEFEIQENGLSGIDHFDLLVINNLNEEKLKLRSPLKQGESERFRRSIERLLPVAKLESGNYKVIVVAFDLAGNGPIKSDPVPFKIRDKPTPSVSPQSGNSSTATSPPMTGSIQGKVRFANGDEPSQAKVTLDSNGMSGEFPKGNFRFSDVPLGKYKITAEFPYQSATWAGEATGEFKTVADFQKQIEIKCKKTP